MATKEAVKGPAALAYGRGFTKREPFLRRARRISRLTVTSLFREQGDTEQTSEDVPWQTFGAYCLNTLSSKATLQAFPPGTPYVKYKAEKSVLDSLGDIPDEQRGALKANIEKGLAAVETEYAEACEEDGDRVVLFDAMRHLLAGGNHGLHVQNDATLRGIPLEQYVVKRDFAGVLNWACIEDLMDYDTAPPVVKDIAHHKGYEITTEAGGNGVPTPDQLPIAVYTYIRRTPTGQYRVVQETWGEEIPKTEYVYDADQLPYLFLRMVALKNEDYGRSYCEDYEGDLQALDGFTQIVFEGSASVATLKWLVKPGGVTNKEMFAKLPNGGVMTGDPEDVGAVSSQYSREIAVADGLIDKIVNRLARIFLLYSSIQRSGERVTAEEIATMRQDLDAGLGGLFSNILVFWQYPMAHVKAKRLQTLGRMTKLPKGTTKLKVLTGDAALGRAQAQGALDQVMQKFSALFPQAFTQFVNPGNYLSRALTAEHVDPDGLAKSDDEIAQEAAQVQQQALAHEVAPEVVRQGGEMIQNQQQADLAPTEAAAPSEGVTS